MKTIFSAFVIIGMLTMPCIAQDTASIKDIKFNPNEAESMLFLYNQTTVSGADVEMVAGLGAKLNEGLKAARALTDTTMTVTLKLTIEEIQFCLGIIKNSTFEAKYAQLVLGMKRKLEALLPRAVRKTDKETR